MALLMVTILYAVRNAMAHLLIAVFITVRVADNNNVERING